MSEGGQQQQQGGQQQQQGSQQQQSPVQLMAQALSNIRKVQNLLELSYPDQTDAIKMQRQAGDAVWQVIQSMQQSQQNQQ